MASLFVIGVCMARAAALFINRYSIRIAIVAYKFRIIKLFQQRYLYFLKICVDKKVCKNVYNVI